MFRWFVISTRGGTSLNNIWLRAVVKFLFQLFTCWWLGMSSLTLAYQNRTAEKLRTLLTIIASPPTLCSQLGLVASVWEVADYLTAPQHSPIYSGRLSKFYITWAARKFPSCWTKAELRRWKGKRLSDEGPFRSQCQRLFSYTYSEDSFLIYC